MFKIQDGRNNFYQWDLDRKLVVEDNSINQVHFCNRTDDNSLVCEVYDEGGLRLVNVPNILLQDIWRINVYGYDVNYTKHSEVFDVYPRTKPSDYVYTETEVLNYNTLLERINEVNETIEDTVEQWLKDNPPEVEVDLTDYATVDYVDEAVSNIKMPDTSSFVTAQYVQTAINENMPDLTDYATKDYVDEAVADDTQNTVNWVKQNYATKDELPDVSDFISEIPSEYITETELNAKGFLTAEDVSGFQTEEQVLALIAEHGGGGANLPASEEGEF